ncbi:MAG: ribosomal protein S18-alanine N-acetyltransferase [Ruminococcus sp.]
MKQKAEIVPASEQDLAALAELAEQCFPDPWSENVFRQTMCCCYNRIWCAKVDGKLCGYAAVSRTGDAVNLDDIAVSPAFRRQGIGRQLLDWAHGQFPESEFWLEVRESNAAAIALYESAGYRQVGFRKRYYHAPEEGAVLMTREVKNMTELANATESFSALGIVSCTSVCADCTEFVESFAECSGRRKLAPRVFAGLSMGIGAAEYFSVVRGV